MISAKYRTLKTSEGLDGIDARSEPSRPHRFRSPDHESEKELCDARPSSWFTEALAPTSACDFF